MDWMVQGFQERSNIMDKAAVVSGGFLWLLSYFQINIQIASILHFKSLCFISVMPCLSLYLGLAIFFRIIGRYSFAYFAITFSKIYTLYFMSWGDLIYYEYLIFLDGNLLGMIQHGWPVV